MGKTIHPAISYVHATYIWCPYSFCDKIVALNAPQYGGGSPGPQCFKSITITYGGKTAQATIMDEVRQLQLKALFLFTPFFNSAWGARTADLISLPVFSITSPLQMMASFTDHGGSMMAPTNLPQLRVPCGRQSQRQRLPPRPRSRRLKHHLPRQAIPRPLPSQPHLYPLHPPHLFLALLRPALPPSIPPQVWQAGSPSLLALQR